MKRLFVFGKVSIFQEITAPMQNDYSSSHFKKLLDKLQQESWQLELIISGFAIYGLFQAVEPLQVELLKSVKSGNTLYVNLLGVLNSGVSILMLNLLVHVVLRGLWIGTLGLRYVSGDIDFNSLRYTQKFTNYLEKKVGPFDRYIARLENICSTLFALAFLMIFYIISFFMVIGVLGIIVYFFNEVLELPETIGKIISVSIVILYSISMLVVFIDFLGAGFLKKYKWTSKIYYPIYRVFGWITLSFLYRPLVYNFLDQKKAKWVAILLLPVYMVFGIFMGAMGNINSNYQTEDQESTAFYTRKYNYEDLLVEKTDLMQFVSIPSKVIEKPYLPVYIGFNDFMEDAIFHKDSTLKPEKDRRGYSLIKGKRDPANSVTVTFDEPDKEYNLKQEKYLKLLSELYQLKIDSLDYNKDFVMTNNKEGRFGFETVLDLDSLPNGKHLLRLVGPTQSKKNDTIFKTDTLITIPFWYYKN